MSFKTISERKEKNKTADINEYMRQYRVDRREHLNNLDRCKYYKKKGLPQELIDNYGELSGAIYKLKIQFRDIIEKNPEIIEQIIDELLKE
jgi:hypothetical protein